MLNARKAILISVVVLLTACTLLTAVAFAWFAVGNRTDTFLLFSGNMDVDATLYYGRDSNKDGILDVTYTNGVPVVVNGRVETLTTYYTEAPRTGSVHSEYIPGTSITYKLVLVNATSNVKDADVEISFSEMESYFYTYISDFMASVDMSAAEKTGSLDMSATAITQRRALLGANTARLMFSLTSLSVRVYNAATAEDTITSGYSTLAKSSIASEVQGAVTAISGLNSEPTSVASELTYHLWQFGDGKNLASFVLESGQLAEIDFKLTCLQGETIGLGYELYSSNYRPAAEAAIDNYLTANSMSLSASDKSNLAAQYVSTMVDEELSYLVDEFTGKELRFVIDYLSIASTQRS